MSKSSTDTKKDVRPTLRRNRRGTGYVFCMATMCLLSCDEVLPPHTEPQALFRSAIYCHYPSKYQTLALTVTVTNTFDETLQDTARLAGTLEIVMADAPEYRKTITIDRRMFPAYGLYDPQTGIMTVNSGDSLSFVYFWDFFTDNGTYLRDVFARQPDPKYPGRIVSPPVTFIVSGFIQVFTRFGQVTFSPVRFVMIYDFSA